MKDNINEMIRNLRETTDKNADQDWLKTNLAKFSRMLQGQKDLTAVSRMVLSELAPLVRAQHGVFFISEDSKENPRFKLLAAYGYKERKNLSQVYRIGEGRRVSDGIDEGLHREPHQGGRLGTVF